MFFRQGNKGQVARGVTCQGRSSERPPPLLRSTPSCRRTVIRKSSIANLLHPRNFHWLTTRDLVATRYRSASAALERELDELVYTLYGLTKEKKPSCKPPPNES